MKYHYLLLSLIAVGFAAPVSAAPKPQWIWEAGGGERATLQKSFTVQGKITEAPLYVTCDNAFELFLNGKSIAKSGDWKQPVERNLADLLQGGENTFRAVCRNEGSSMGFVLRLQVETEGLPVQHLVSDASWKGRPGPQARKDAWKTVQVFGPLGMAPWGVPKDTAPVASTKAPKPKSAVLAPADITLPEGFVVDLVYEVPKQQGSWVSLTIDEQGVLYASDQKGAGLYRIQPGAPGREAETTVTRLSLKTSGAMGLLADRGVLYANLGGSGLHRIADTDGDGTFDAAEQILPLQGGGEHGQHALLPDPNGDGLFMINGNHTTLPKDFARSRVTGWQEDLLLPRQWDARGHAKGRLAPGGWIATLDRDGGNLVPWSIGYRNPYDFALNRHGDVFTYDADMEWDMGMPWYRPTRICFAPSGSDFGWRSGTGKWPSYYADSLPAILDIGPGSPTGVLSGQGLQFPTNYQDAIFALDWTFGTLYAVHLTPEGSGYRATSEQFLSGTPLPLTDAVVGRDGAMYFAIGGRGIASALYRVRYTGSQPTAPPTQVDPALAGQRDLRRSLERFHGVHDAGAVAAAWPHLDSEDRWLRHAARVAVESQPVSEWAEQALSETRPRALVQAAVALARQGGEAYRAPLLARLMAAEASHLGVEEQLGLMRAYALAFMRLGAPTSEENAAIRSRLEPMLPADDDRLNTELVRLLVYLKSPVVVEKTLSLIEERRPPEVPDWHELITRSSRYGGTIARMLENPPPSREIGFAFMLRNVRYGWTLAQRERYFRFLQEAEGFPGGASYRGFVGNLRKEALEQCSDAEKRALASLTGAKPVEVAAVEVVPPKGPGRAWTVTEAVKAVEAAGGRGADFESGRNLFHATACAACHRFDGAGGDIGPDLTTVRNKFPLESLMESIIEPSKVISDQYGSFVVALKDGSSHMGLVVEQDDGSLWVYPPTTEAEPVKVPKGQVASVTQSPVSQMPPGLIYSLNPHELRDLVAYLLSQGNPSDPWFGKE